MGGGGDSPVRGPSHPAAGRRELPCEALCAPVRVGVQLSRAMDTQVPSREPCLPLPSATALWYCQRDPHLCPLYGGLNAPSPRSDRWSVDLDTIGLKVLSIPYSCVHSAPTPTQTHRSLPAAVGQRPAHLNGTSCDESHISSED